MSRIAQVLLACWPATEHNIPRNPKIRKQNTKTLQPDLAPENTKKLPKKCKNVRVGYWQNGFCADFHFGASGFFWGDFVAGFFSSFLWENESHLDI